MPVPRFRFAGDARCSNPPAVRDLNRLSTVADGQGNVRRPSSSFAGDGTFQERVQTAR